MSAEPFTRDDIIAAAQTHVGCAFSLHELVVIIRGLAELDGGKRWAEPDGQIIRAEVLRAVTPLVEKANGHGAHERVLGVLLAAAYSDEPPDDRASGEVLPLPRRRARRPRR